MSTRTTLRPQLVITSGDMSASLTSKPTILQSLTGVSYQVVWSGGSTPVGTLSVQASNNYALNPDGTALNAGTWTTLTLSVNGTPSTTIAVSGNSGSALIDPINTDAYAIRLIYTAASGGGTLNVTFNGKVK